MTLRGQIKDWLRGCDKLAILGIGNLMRRDDFIGMEIVKLLKGKVPKKVKLLECQTAPENFIEEVILFNPTHILIIDAAQLGAEPGEARLVLPEGISGIVLSTHIISLSVLTELLQSMINVKVIILGVQPKNIEFGEELTPEIQKASNKIANLLTRVLSEVIM